MYSAIEFFFILAVFAWLYVQLVMLVVFIKYGTPLQKDTKVLIANKLQIYNE